MSKVKEFFSEITKLYALCLVLIVAFSGGVYIGIKAEQEESSRDVAAIIGYYKYMGGCDETPDPSYTLAGN